ncbi:MAG: hypothetical protein A4E26_02032 [Methanobacterium sp. PtaU1.Bin097]|nr:MAG: hypothetical protein A4E26_02032 [Methanobacterium sp. PtaU1.Bin097]
MFPMELLIKLGARLFVFINELRLLATVTYSDLYNVPVADPEGLGALATLFIVTGAVEPELS